MESAYDGEDFWMADKFENHAVGLSSPAVRAVTITPNDAAELSSSLRGYTVGGSGDLAVVFVDDTESVVLPGRIAGVDYGGRIKKILATGTTATTIVGFF
jgi:hypothetical protein